jgi:hypothetical protein
MKIPGIALVLGLASTASAQYLLIGSESASTAAGTVFGAGSGITYKAAGFSIASRPYELTRVDLTLDLTGGGTPQVSIWTGAAAPEQQVGSLAPDPLSGGPSYTPAQPLTIATNQNYWVHVRADPASLGTFTWGSASAPPIGMGTPAGYVQDGQSSQTYNGFTVWGTFDCYANCDGSTASPVLNVADFTCFLQQFAQGSTLPGNSSFQACHYANCDPGAIPPCHVICLNVADFTCFLQRFAAASGCQ